MQRGVGWPVGAVQVMMDVASKAPGLLHLAAATHSISWVNERASQQGSKHRARSCVTANRCPSLAVLMGAENERPCFPVWWHASCLRDVNCSRAAQHPHGPVVRLDQQDQRCGGSPNDFQRGIQWSVCWNLHSKGGG
jgi:hypothetical protein